MSVLAAPAFSRTEGNVALPTTPLTSCVSLIFFISSEAYAGDEEKIKRSLINNFTDNLSSAVQNFLDGEGETKVQIDMGEDYKPEFSIVTVKPISKHHSVDATFIQLQINEQKN
jgi:hypothetical protein